MKNVMDAEAKLKQIKEIVYSDLSSSKARLLTMIVVAPDPISAELGQLPLPFHLSYPTSSS